MDPFQKYLAAKQRYSVAAQRLEDAGDYLSQVGDYLLDTNRLASDEAGFTLPDDIALCGWVQRNGSAWPTAEQAAELVVEWRRAVAELEGAWQMLPQEYREDMRPPKILGERR